MAELAQYIRMQISIHAPREGGDQSRNGSTYGTFYFNPRPPRGGRRRSAHMQYAPTLFQSTPPARGATSLRP